MSCNKLSKYYGIITQLKIIPYYMYDEHYNLVCWTRILIMAYLSGDLNAIIW